MQILSDMVSPRGQPELHEALSQKQQSPNTWIYKYLSHQQWKPSDLSSTPRAHVKSQDSGRHSNLRAQWPVCLADLSRFRPVRDPIAENKADTFLRKNTRIHTHTHERGQGERKEEGWEG